MENKLKDRQFDIVRRFNQNFEFINQNGNQLSSSSNEELICEEKTEKKNYKYEVLYFVPAVDGIRYFLSHYDPDKSTLVITNDNIESINKLLKIMLPDQKIISIPNLKFNGFPTTEEVYELQIKELEAYKKKYIDILNQYLPVKKAYMFSNHSQFNFFILLNQLESEGAQVSTIKVDFENSFTPVESKYLPTLFKLHLEKMTKIIGYKMYLLSMTVSDYTVNIGIGPLSHLKSIEYKPLSWYELADKFSLNFTIDTKGAVLFIDTPIQYYYRGVNVLKTQNNIGNFFKKLMLEGKKIHLKPHYQDAAKSHSLSGSEIERSLQILPSFFPVQLIMEEYSEIYAYSSSSLIAPIEGKKYSLSRFVEFNSVDTLFNYWIHLFEYQLISLGNVKCIILPDGLIEIKNKDHYYASYQGQLKESESIIPNILVSIAETKIIEGQIEYASQILSQIEKKWPEVYPDILGYLTQNSLNILKDSLYNKTQHNSTVVSSLGKFERLDFSNCDIS